MENNRKELEREFEKVLEAYSPMSRNPKIASTLKEVFFIGAAKSVKTLAECVEQEDAKRAQELQSEVNEFMLDKLFEMHFGKEFL